MIRAVSAISALVREFPPLLLQRGIKGGVSESAISAKRAKDYCRWGAGLLLILLTMVFGGCQLDGFLFNTETVDFYSLPGNTIPDSLLEEVTFQSENEQLFGYWIRSNGERPGLAILYCHGNKHNLDEYWDRAIMLHGTGANVLIYDYRGFGRSEGSSSEEGIKRDADASLQFVIDRGFLPDSIAIMGYSLGNVPAIYLAAHRVSPRCLISESPFASANSLTQGSIALDIPARWLTEGKFDNGEQIKLINTPFLLIHGAKDDFVRWRDNGRVVYDNAPDPKKLLLVEQGNHNDIPAVMGDSVYVARLKAWIWNPVP